MTGRSCTTQLPEVLDIWTRFLEEGGCVDVMYLYFAKAFDTVSHRRLMAKLRGYSISGKVWELIGHILTDRKQCVIVNGETSGYEDVSSGTPQGSVLGPLLFFIYINDLRDEVASLIKLFADDTKLFAKIVRLQDCADLQKDLTALQFGQLNGYSISTLSNAK